MNLRSRALPRGALLARFEIGVLLNASGSPLQVKADIIAAIGATREHTSIEESRLVVAAVVDVDDAVNA